MVKETSTTVTSQPTSTPIPLNPSTNCNQYKGEGEIIHRYTVVLHEATSNNIIHSLIRHLLDKRDEHGSMINVDDIQPLLDLKLFTAEMNMDAVKYVC